MDAIARGFTAPRREYRAPVRTRSRTRCPGLLQNTVYVGDWVVPYGYGENQRTYCQACALEMGVEGRKIANELGNGCNAYLSCTDYTNNVVNLSLWDASDLSRRLEPREIKAGTVVRALVHCTMGDGAVVQCSTSTWTSKYFFQSQLSSPFAFTGSLRLTTKVYRVVEPDTVHHPPGASFRKIPVIGQVMIMGDHKPLIYRRYNVDDDYVPLPIHFELQLVAEPDDIVIN